MQYFRSRMSKSFKKRAMSEEASSCSASSLLNSKLVGEVVVPAVVVATTDRFKIGSFSRSAPSHDNEDRVISSVRVNKNIVMTAVIDGHGGFCCSEFISEKLPQEIKARIKMINENSTVESLGEEVFIQQVIDACETHFLQICGMNDSGCCVLFALVDNFHFYVASIGDCRAVLFQQGKISQLTKDHRTTVLDESARIYEAGGWIVNDRILGVLSPSRAFGNKDLKLLSPSGVISLVPSSHFQEIPSPSSTVEKANDDLDFVILATDGIWDCLTNEQACEIVKSSLFNSSGNVEEAAKVLIQAASTLNDDDISVSIIVFN